jgi:hypothetical protein
MDLHIFERFLSMIKKEAGQLAEKITVLSGSADICKVEPLNAKQKTHN